MPPRPAILDRLKQSTRAHHARVEAHVRVLEPNFTTDDYRKLLTWMWGFYRPVEARLAAHSMRWQALGLDPEKRWKAARLEQDLGELGIGQGALARLPLCTDLPALNSAPGALGCMYVLEGATLGGAIIARHLQRVWGIRSTFFGSYGSTTGAMWTAFGCALAAYETTTGSGNQIVEGACDTFNKLDAWLLEMA
jgi:heme oxygenase